MTPKAENLINLIRSVFASETGREPSDSEIAEIACEVSADLHGLVSAGYVRRAVVAKVGPKQRPEQILTLHEERACPAEIKT